MEEDTFKVVVAGWRDRETARGLAQQLANGAAAAGLTVTIEGDLNNRDRTIETVEPAPEPEA